MTVYKWDKATPLNNATADGTIDWQENMSPAAVNNSARAMMTAVAKWRDDIGGTLVTSGGPVAYTIATTNQGPFPATPPDGTSLSFQVNQTNNANATLRIDAGTTYPLQTSAGTAVAASLLRANTVYSATFRTGTNAWILNNVYNPSGLVPVGTIFPFVGTIAPTNFQLCFGQSLTQALFPELHALISAAGYPYGGSGVNFNVPDLRGRVAAGKDNMGGATAAILTGLTIAPNAITLGAKGGFEGHTMTAAELAPHSHNITDPGHSHTYTAPSNVTGATLGGSGNTATAAATTGSQFTGITINNNVQSAQMNMLQPTIILNYIIRVL